MIRKNSAEIVRESKTECCACKAAPRFKSFQAPSSILQTDLQTLVFSADAASEPLYSKMRVNGNLDKIVRNIEKFYEIKEKEYSSSKLITRVSGVRYSEDQNIEEMEKFWSRFVDQVAFVDYNPWENAYDSEKTLIETPCSDLWRRMFIWWDVCLMLF